MTEFSFWLDYPFKTFNFLSCNITPSYLLFYPHLFHLQLDLFETTQHFLELRDHLFDLFSYCSLALPLLAMFLQTRVPPRRPYFPLRSVHLQPIPECPGAAQLAGGHLGWEKTSLIRVRPITVWLSACLGSLLVMPERHPSPLAMSVIFRLMNVVPILNVGWVAPVTSDLQNMVAVEGMQQLRVIPSLDASALPPDLPNAPRVPPVARMPVLLGVNRRRSSPLRSLHPQLFWERGYSGLHVQTWSVCGARRASQAKLAVKRRESQILRVHSSPKADLENNWFSLHPGHPQRLFFSSASPLVHCVWLSLSLPL